MPRSGEFSTAIVPSHHRLIYQLCDIMKDDRWSANSVAKKAGLTQGAINRWRLGLNPNIANFEAALNVMGYELVIKERPK